jgi:outer membrane autotransporter protein
LFSLYFATLSTAGFTESNAGVLNLSVPGQTPTSVQTEVGVRASTKTKIGNGTLAPQVSAVWQHEYSDNARGLDARLAQGSSTISLRIQDAGRNFAVLGANPTARFSKRVTADVGYTAEVGRSHSSNMGVNVGLRIAF